MSSLEPTAASYASLGLGLWASKGRANHLSSPQVEGEARQKNSPEYPNQDKKRFSNRDIDAILKKSGISITPEHRQLARFMLRHHVQLNPEIFSLVEKISAEGSLQGYREEALIAAMSKLPQAWVELGFRTILLTLENATPVLASLTELKSLLDDMVSESFNLKNFSGGIEDFRSAIQNESTELQKILISEPKEQVALLVQRWGLATRLHQVYQLFANLSRIIEHFNLESEKRLLLVLNKSRKLSRNIIKSLMTDAILSREDMHHHLKESGVCYSLGLSYMKNFLPCRLWAQDRSNPSAKNLDSENISMFIRWHTEALGLLEAKVSIQSPQLEVTFFSRDSDVAEIIDSKKSQLIDKLKGLGYEVNHKDTQSKTKADGEETKIENHSQKTMTHLDAKA